MERPIFVPVEPHVYVIQPPAPALDSRVFVADQGRWYERLKDENGNAYYVHIADGDLDFHARMEQEGLPAAVEIAPPDALAEVVLEEFSRTGRLYVDVAEISESDLAQLAGR